MTKLTYKFIDSPVGKLKIIAEGSILIAILWEHERLNRVCLQPLEEDRNSPFLKKVEQQLNEYFKYKRLEFDLPISAKGTPFQEQVWQALRQIPYGTTCSYTEVAKKINRPKAVRAVGTAIGRNPISIIIPCHRVVGSDGSLTGFAGGLEKKQILLDLELD